MHLVKIGRLVLNLEQVQSIDLGAGPGDSVSVIVDAPHIRGVVRYGESGGLELTGPEAEALRGYLLSLLDADLTPR